MNNNLKKLMEKYPSLSYSEEKGKIVCNWTKHELPATEKAINEYVNGRKYQHLLTSTSSKLNVNDYTEFLRPCKEAFRPNQMFCRLTFKIINNQADHIEKHVNGKKFQKALKHWNHCKETNQKYRPPGYQKQKRNDHDSDNDNQNDLNDDEEFIRNFQPGESSEDDEPMEEGEGENDDDEEEDDDDDEEIEFQRKTEKRKFSSNISSNKKSQPRKKKFNSNKMNND